MALALMGSEGTLSQAASTATDRDAHHLREAWPVVSARKAQRLSRGHHGEGRRTPTSRSTRRRGGSIIIPGGSITEGSTVTVASYSYGTIDYKTIVGANANVIEGYLRFIGDPATGPEFELEVWRVQAQPDGAFGLITEDYGNFSLTLKVLDDSANHATRAVLPPPGADVRSSGLKGGGGILAPFFRGGLEKITIGGRTFVPVKNSTIEHDFWLMAHIRGAGLDRIAIEEGEASDDFAVRFIGGSNHLREDLPDPGGVVPP